MSRRFLGLTRGEVASSSARFAEDAITGGEGCAGTILVAFRSLVDRRMVEEDIRATKETTVDAEENGGS